MINYQVNYNKIVHHGDIHHRVQHTNIGSNYYMKTKVTTQAWVYASAAKPVDPFLNFEGVLCPWNWIGKHLLLWVRTLSLLISTLLLSEPSQSHHVSVCSSCKGNYLSRSLINLLHGPVQECHSLNYGQILETVGGRTLCTQQKTPAKRILQFVKRIEVHGNKIAF
jgi:hypothetical protein